MTVYVQGKAQKAPERTLSLHLSLIFSIETAYSYQKKEITKKVEGQNLISMDTMLLDSNGRCSTKKSQGIHRNRKVLPIQKKKNKSTETVLEKELRTHLLDQEFKYLV